MDSGSGYEANSLYKLINWVSQKDPEVSGRGKALGFVPSVRYSIGVEMRFLRFFFFD